MRRMMFWLVSTIILLVGSACAETIPPMKLDPPLDSLMYSTTEWSEPVNGLQMRVTYPMEVEYGEPVEIILELRLPASGGDSRQDNDYPGGVRLTLRNKLTDSTASFGNLIFKLTAKDCANRSECIVATNAIFQVANLKTSVPVFQYPGGEEKRSPVTELQGPSEGIYDATVSVLPLSIVSDKLEGLSPVSFTITIRPSARSGHPIVIICPVAIRLNSSCQAEYTGIDTTVVHSRPHHFVGTILQCQSMRMSGKNTVPDTISFVKECSPSVTLTGKGSDSMVFTVVETVDPPGHFWLMSAQGITEPFKRIVKYSTAPADIEQRKRCGRSPKK